MGAKVIGRARIESRVLVKCTRAVSAEQREKTE
jgi:hypothetical protein